MLPWDGAVTQGSLRQHVRRITFYVLLIFGGFLVSRLILSANVRSEGAHQSRLVTEVEIHSLQARWGIDLLAVPIISMAIMVAQRGRRVIGSAAVASLIALLAAGGTVYVPSAVMGGHIGWPLGRAYFFDTSGYVDIALFYSAVVVTICVIVNRIAASKAEQ
jgi:hypothetical protein